MLGIPDFWVALAYWLCILSTILCVVYGVMNWNNESEEDAEPTPADVQWVKEEEKIDESLA